MNILLARIAIAVLWGIICTGIVVYFYNSLIRLFIKRKALRDAIEMGRVISAKRIEVKGPYYLGRGNTRDSFAGIYEYEYQGKRYTCRLMYSGRPPMTETLYFKKNPEKATNDFEFGKMENGKISIFLFFTVMSFLISLL